LRFGVGEFVDKKKFFNDERIREVESPPRGYKTRQRSLVMIAGWKEFSISR
jgi:hypothetical protein